MSNMLLSKPLRRIAVVGTGVIGASWTALYLARGFDVTATDPAPNAEANLRRYVDRAWQTLLSLGLSPKASPEHLCFSTDLRHALADSDLVQESAPEDGALKIKLFAEMDLATPVDSIIASSSSGLTMSLMQSACLHPERCVIARPVNPPHIIPLVEVAAGARTSPEAVQRALSFYAAIGRKPIYVRKEVAGHVANRLQAALYHELARLIAEEALDVDDADAAVCWGPGLHWGVMGPSLLLYLGAGPEGGHDLTEHWPVTARRQDPCTQVLTPQLKQSIIEGALRQAGGRTVQQLASERDELLLGLIHLRRKVGEATTVAHSNRSRKKM